MPLFSSFPRIFFVVFSTPISPNCFISSALGISFLKNSLYFGFSCQAWTIKFSISIAVMQASAHSLFLNALDSFAASKFALTQLKMISNLFSIVPFGCGLSLAVNSNVISFKSLLCSTFVFKSLFSPALSHLIVTEPLDYLLYFEL